MLRTNTRALGSTLSPTCDFISKPSDFREVTSHQRHPSSPRLSCALVPPQEDPGYLQPRETKPRYRGEPRGLPRSRSPIGPGENLRAASPTAPAAVGTRGLPAPASRALFFPHVLLAAVQNYKLQWRPVRHHGEPPLCPSSRGAAGPPRA